MTATPTIAKFCHSLYSAVNYGNDSITTAHLLLSLLPFCPVTSCQPPRCHTPLRVNHAHTCLALYLSTVTALLIPLPRLLPPSPPRSSPFAAPAHPTNCSSPAPFTKIPTLSLAGYLALDACRECASFCTSL